MVRAPAKFSGHFTVFYVISVLAVLTRIAHIAVALVLSMTVGLVSLGAYPLAWAGDVSCCCGDHSVANECGCPSCPAAHDEDSEDQLEDRLVACGASTTFAPSQALKLAPPAPVFVLVPPAPTQLWPQGRGSPALPSQVYRPEVPDS